MSHPREYPQSKDRSREQLETWINQVEELQDAKTIAIRVNEVGGQTILTVDCDIPRPGPARIQMGHIAAGGADPVQGKAFVLGQKMDITVLR